MAMVVITSSNFLFAGLDVAWSNGSAVVELIHATAPETIPKIQMCTGVQIIMIAAESDSPSERVRNQVIQWHLEFLMTTGVLQQIPVIQLTGDMRIRIFDHVFIPTQKHFFFELMSIITDILKNAAHYEKLRKVTKKRLTQRQKSALAGTLAGYGVNEIAEFLHIQPSVVFSHRKTLIENLGLRNRLELMLLKTDDFEEMRDYLF